MEAEEWSDEVELVAEGDTNMVSAKRVLAVVLAAALVFAGCTGDDDDEATEDLEGASPRSRNRTARSPSTPASSSCWQDRPPAHRHRRRLVRRRRPKRAACTWSVTARADAVSAQSSRVEDAGVSLAVTFADDTTDPRSPRTAGDGGVPRSRRARRGHALGRDAGHARGRADLRAHRAHRHGAGRVRDLPRRGGQPRPPGRGGGHGRCATIAGYAPFHQSSRGTACWSTAPCRAADIGATDPGLLDIRFEIDPDEPTGRYFLFHGPEHGNPRRVHRFTGRPFEAPDAIFRHWQGGTSGCRARRWRSPAWPSTPPSPTSSTPTSSSTCRRRAPLRPPVGRRDRGLR